MGDPRLWRGVRAALGVATVVVVVVDGAGAGSLSRRHDSTPSASRGVACCQESALFDILALPSGKGVCEGHRYRNNGASVVLVNNLSVGVWGS